jgi:hypothetical protein
MECGLTSAIQFQSDVTKQSASRAERASASSASHRNTSVFAACALGCGFAVVSAFGAAPVRAHFDPSSQLAVTLDARDQSTDRSALTKTPASNPGEKKKKSTHAAKKSSKKSHDSDELASTKKPKAAKAGPKPAEETSMNAASDDPLEGL